MILTRSLESYMNLEEERREYYRRQYEYEIRLEPWFKRDIHVAKARKAYYPYAYCGIGEFVDMQDFFQRLQEAVNAGLDEAEREFPIGTKISYPYVDDHGYWSRPELRIAHYQSNLPTKNGPTPGAILLHTEMEFRELPFSGRSKKFPHGSSRYRDSIVHDYLTTKDDDGFQAGLPEKFLEVVTPLRLRVPAYVDGKKIIDRVEASFFLPSLWEIGFDQQGRERKAAWSFINYYRAWWYKEGWREEYPCFFRGKDRERGALCWLRTVDRDYDCLVKVMHSSGKIGVYNADSSWLTCAPACAIVKKS